MRSAKSTQPPLYGKVCILIVIIFVNYIFHELISKYKKSICEKFLFIYERKLSTFGGIISLNESKVNRAEIIFRRVLLQKLNISEGSIMKIAIIGYGGMGNNHKKYIIQRLNDSDYPEKLEIAGVYDISPERKAFAAELGLKNFDSADEIWNDDSIKIVLVATPNDSHLPYVLKAAECGKNIIVEKPAALSSEETEKMYEAAKKAGVVFSPHQNRRWDDDYLTVRNMYEKQTVGKVYRIESRVMGSNGIPGAWRRVERQGGGMMLDWGVHLIDQMLQFVKSPVKSVYCDYSYIAGEEVDDGFDLEVKFEDGLIYRIVVDTNTFIELPRWQVYGTDGTATITNWRRDNVEGRVVRCIQRVDDKLEGVNAGNGFTKTMAARRSETVEEFPPEIVRGDKNAFYRNFMDAVIKGEPTIVRKEEVMRVFKIMELAKKSARENRVITERV